MHVMPPEYHQALLQSGVKIDAYVAIGTRIDPTASDDISSIEGDFLPMSNPEQVTDANYVMTRWMATFEADGIKTSADSSMLAPPISPEAYPPQVGLWSKVISDGDGVVDFTFTFRFRTVHTSAFTLYTYDQNILAGTISYLRGSDVVRTAPMVASSGRVQDEEGGTYDGIRIHVEKIDKTYSHVKISEAEFGASETYGGSRLSGNITLVREWDPLMQTIPLHELDFSVLNVLGELDPDNPSGGYERIKQDYPVEFSLSITAVDGSKWTVPCGRYMITSKKATETTLDIVCLDARSALEQNQGGLTLSTGTSFGEMFTQLFKGLHIPFVVDEPLFAEYPDQDIVFPGETYDLLTIMRFIEQYFDIWLIPERGGSIRVMKSVPEDDFGLLEPDMMTTYPLSDVANTFNYIAVSYGPEDAKQEYVLDMRTDLAQLRSQLSVLNPLVKTLEKAQAIALKVRTALYSERVQTEWRGDPTLDVTDLIDIEGKWTEGQPVKYRVLGQDLTYDGGLFASTTAFR